MNARRHEDAAHEPITRSECESRRWCGWIKWGVMLSVLSGVIIAGGWLLLFDLGTRDIAHGQDLRLQAEETRSTYVDADIKAIKDSVKGIEAEMKTIRIQQAEYFGAKK